MTAKPIIHGVRQIGLYAPDPTVLAEFYAAVLGLEIFGQGDINADGVRHSVFLRSESGPDHNQIAIYANPEMQHAALQVDSLADLRTLYQRIVACERPIRWALNHGVSLAFYFDDPAGNLIKLYWPTGESYPQPHGHPIDLSQSEAALRQDVADLVAQLEVSKGG